MVDVSGGCGSSFDVLIVSTRFEGVALLARQVQYALVLVVLTRWCFVAFNSSFNSFFAFSASLSHRQRLVNTALAAEMSRIHALTMKTLTPAEFEKRRETLRAEFQ